MRNVLWILALGAAFLAIGCGPSVVGRACDTGNPCPSNFVCAAAHDGVDRCMRACSLNPNQTVCSDGTVCLPIATTGGGGACYLGGNVAIAGTCTSDLDCTRTAICISAGAISECRVGCNLDGSHGCGGGFFCQPTAGMAAGYCMSN